MPLVYGSHGSVAVLLEECKKFGLSWETIVSVFCAMLAATVDTCISSLFPRTWQPLVRCCMMLRSARICGGVVSACSAYWLDTGYMYGVSLRGFGMSGIFYVNVNSDRGFFALVAARQWHARLVLLVLVLHAPCFLRGRQAHNA